jgi:molybdate transport system substrate-binding protein
MGIKGSVIMLGVMTAIAMVGMGNARAAEITVLANQGGFTGARDLAAAFEQSTGHKVVVVSAQSAVMNRKIDANEPADVVSQFLDQFEDLVKRGKVVPGSYAEYTRVGNGIAVKAGAPKPDISTPEAFKRAMLNAKSISYSNNGTGPYNTRLFQKLGIYDQIKDKIVISGGGPVAADVAAGKIEIGIQQTNVIQPFPGTDYVGPLPPELIEYGHIGIGLLTVSKQPDVARAFLKFATSPEAGPLLRKSAMEPPAK